MARPAASLTPHSVVTVVVVHTPVVSHQASARQAKCRTYGKLQTGQLRGCLVGLGHVDVVVLELELERTAAFAAS